MRTFLTALLGIVIAFAIMCTLALVLFLTVEYIALPIGHTIDEQRCQQEYGIDYHATWDTNGCTTKNGDWRLR